MGPAELIVTFFLIGFVLVAVLVALSLFKISSGPVRAVDATLDPARRQLRSDRNRPLRATKLECAHCGARLDDSTEISPSGEVQCPHCARRFSVHPD